MTEQSEMSQETLLTLLKEKAKELTKKSKMLTKLEEKYVELTRKQTNLL